VARLPPAVAAATTANRVSLVILGIVLLIVGLLVKSLDEGMLHDSAPTGAVAGRPAHRRGIR